MATVVFLDDNIRVKVPAGMSMRKVAEKTGASMEFGCRVGDCATCVAYVKTGGEALSDKTEKERDALKLVGLEGGDMRLMCQCEVRSDEGEIMITQRF